MMKRTIDGGLRFIAARTGIGVGLLLVAAQAGAQQVIPQQGQMAPGQTYPAQQVYPAQPPQQPVYAQPQQPVYAPQPQMAPQPAMAPAAPAPAAGAANEDQRMWVGHIGISWFGTIPVAIGTNPGAGAGLPGAAGDPINTLNTPMVGIRYWLAPNTGLDLGVGFRSTGGSFTDNNGVSTDDAAFTTFALHAGIPIVLGNSQHMSVQLTPEANLGIGTGSQKVAGNDVTFSGLEVDVGARAGAEVYFGFIGLPALALEGSVGLFLRSTSTKTESAGQSWKKTSLELATSSINQPWDIFRANIAARYYF